MKYLWRRAWRVRETEGLPYVCCRDAFGGVVDEHLFEEIQGLVRRCSKQGPKRRLWESSELDVVRQLGHALKISAERGSGLRARSVP